ncbi:MAG TPA: choice-of-anchor J domain-containing protein [Candidatus Cloacimonas sp.]|nr:choice-of-anchor J domain-containing protein [Candidatus Cloacimonas sp.]
MTTSNPTSAPNPAVLVSPANDAWAMIGDILSWNSGGGFPSSYDVYFGTSSTPPLVSDNQTALTYTPTLAAGNTYYWKVVPANLIGEATGCPTWSFKTPTTTQVAESFENTSFPPAGWANPGSWSRSTSYYKQGVASAYKYTSDTSKYILSTPKVTITSTSTLSLWTLCSSTSGTIEVIYSPDRTTWTQLSSITHAAAYTWYNKVVDLSSLTGNNYYLGVRTGGQSYTSYYVDLVIGPEITPEAPGAPTLSTPADLATNVNEFTTFTWTAPTTGGVPTGYKLYCDTSNPPTTLKADLNALTYTLTTSLAYNTTYYWTVLAYNGAGNGTTATVRSFTTRTNPTISTFPYTAGNFENGGALPLNWIASEGATGASYHWAASTGASSHGPAAPHSGTYFGWLYCYLASNSYNPYYLTTAPIALDATAKRLTYWYWIGTDTYANPLFVEISTDNQATWTTLYTHSNTSNTLAWYQNTLSLEAYTSHTVYLRFKGMSNYGSNMTDLGLDDIVIEDIPAAPIISCTPTSWDFGQTIINTTKTKDFTISNTGGGTLSVSSIVIEGDYYTLLTNPAPAGLTAGQTATFTVQYAPTAVGTQNGTVTITDNRGVTTVNLSAICYDPTIYTFPWVENFGTTTNFPPLNWSRLTGLYPSETPVTTTSGWTYDDFANVVTTPQNMSGRLNIYYTSTKYWLVTPPIAIPGAGYELKFDLALTTYSGIATSPTPGAQADDKFIVLISDSPMMTNPTVLGEWNNTGSSYVYDNISPSGENHIISLNTYSGTKYLAFYGESTVAGGDNNVYVDNVTVRETPAAPIFNYSPTSIAFGTGFANTPTAYQNVTVTNTGAGVLNLAVADVNIIGADASMFSFNPANLPAALSTNQSVTIPVRYNPTAIGNHTATLRMVYNATNYDVTLSGNALGEHALYQGFEGATFPPTGWATATAPWEIYTTYAHTGTKSVKSGYSTGTWWLMTPTLAIEDGANTLTFWYRDYSSETSWDYDDEYTYVMLSTTGNAPEDFTTTLWTGDYLTFTTTWQMASIDLSAYNGQNVIIAFKSIHTGGNYRIIDDVAGPNLYVPSGPPEVVTLVYPTNGATGIPQTGFNLTWTPATTGGVPNYYAVYMTQDETLIYDDYRWETNNTYFNPVTEGGITFNYLDRWYWTVEAINDDGSAVVEPPYSFEIRQAPIAISTFPWTENFDASLNLPTDWTMVDVDGAGTYWQASTAYSHSSPNSFVHSFSTAVDDGQNGWLITPAIQVPQTGNFVLSWWNYNVYPSWMVYNGLLVNTTNDPNDPNWVELWAPTTVAAAWSNAVVNITPYAGQTVYFAFNYQGYDADNWYIDDVSIYELLVDEYPPVITHLPILNTPRNDTNYLVYAEIADDPNWNNPIGGASVYYSTDSGTTWNGPIAMTPGTEPAYTAYIPAQPLGTTVQYYIQAWDSLNNMATTDTYSFAVNNPVWIWYDTGGTVYLGIPSQAFGPTVLYENPYYGTGIPMKLLGTDGESYNAVTANLHIYSYDGTDIVDLITPIPVSFAAQTYQTIDLSSYDINITTPYFMIAYEDMPAGNYFLFDETYDYGTTFVKMSGTLYTLSTSGSWCIGAYVTNGTATIAAPVATIANVGGNPVISWNAVSGANAYNIWNASDPYSAQWTLLATTTGTTYTYTGSDSKKFFRVTATTDIPAKGVRNVNGLALGNNNQIGLTHSSIQPVKASKAKIEKLLRK